MFTPYQDGQHNAAVTTNPPSTQMLLNTGYTFDQASSFLQGFAEAKK